MKTYEFLRKVTKIELSQVKYVFGDWIIINSGDED